MLSLQPIAGFEPATFSYEQKKHHVYIQTREHLKEILKKILDYNLHCPFASLGRFNFDVDEEMGRIAIENLIRE